MGPVSLVVDAPVPPLLRGRVIDAATGMPVRAGIGYFFDCPPGPEPELGRRIEGGWSTEGEATKGLGVGGGGGSDDSGAFCIDRLKPGEYKLRVAAPGYREATVGPFLLAAKQVLDGIEVRLEPETPTDRPLSESGNPHPHAPIVTVDSSPSAPGEVRGIASCRVPGPIRVECFVGDEAVPGSPDESMTDGVNEFLFSIPPGARGRTLVVRATGPTGLRTVREFLLPR